MNFIEKILFALICIGVMAGGFVATWNYLNPAMFQDFMGRMTGMVNPVVAPMQRAYNMIPEQIRPFVPMLGLAGLTAFFAWAKMRWQGYAKQKELELKTREMQHAGERQEMQERLSLSTTEGMKRIITEKDNALSSRDEAQKMFTSLQSQYDELQRKYADAMSMVKNVRSPTDEVMKRMLEEAGYVVKQRVP